MCLKKGLWEYDWIMRTLYSSVDQSIGKFLAECARKGLQREGPGRGGGAFIQAPSSYSASQLSWVESYILADSVTDLGCILSPEVFKIFPGDPNWKIKAENQTPR